jgi:phosphohistidine phosphatase SixA
MSLRRFLAAAFLAWFAAAAAAEADPWALLQQGGNVLLIRHAATELGVGDPAGFRIDDCSTQRNLTDGGRADARRLGEVLRARGVKISEVRSSQWCRCLETARLAFGQAQAWSALNSIFADASREAEQNRAVLALAATVKPPANVALVGHSHNIRSLVGVTPAQLEVVIARYDGSGLKVVGRVPPP